MADLSKLLHAQADDIEDVLLPVGTWRVTAKKASLSEPKFSEKLGCDFQQAVFVLVPKAPLEDVDAAEIAALEDVPSSITIFYRKGPMYRNGDYKSLVRLLKAAGIPSTGRTVEQMLAEVDGQEFLAEVTTEEYEGETRNSVKKFYVEKEAA